MSPQAVVRHRAKVSVTVDSDVLRAVDQYIDEHPSAGRSQVFDEALLLWFAKRQEEEMVAQFTAPQSPEERQERAAWKRIQAEAAEKLMKATEAE